VIEGSACNFDLKPFSPERFPR